MTETAMPKPRREARLSTGYVATWMALAGLSLGYMALVATQPELVGEYTAQIRLFETAADPAADARVQAEMKSLRMTLAQAQLDIAKVKTELQSETEKATALSARLATMEQQAAAKPAEAPPAQTAQAAAPAPVAQASAPAQQAEAAPQQPEVKRIAVVPQPAAAETASVKPDVKAHASQMAATMASATSDAQSGAKAAAQKGIETGSITAPAAFGPAVVKPAPVVKPVGLKLANSTSVDALRLTWGLINERHGDSIKSLKPRYTSGGNPAAPSYDLIAGPVKNAVEAKRLCKVLATKGISCSVGNFDGNAL